MLFKIKNTDVRISFSIFAFILLALVLSDNHIFLYTFLTALIHETVHIIFIKIFGDDISQISFSIFGASIKRKESYQTNNFKEAVINLSAPIFNVFIGFLLIIFDAHGVFSTINLVTGIFNLLPFYTFDGGRGLYYALLHFLSQRVSEIILTVTSIIITAGFSFLVVYIFLNYTSNLVLIIMNVYLIFSVISSIFLKNMKL